MAPAASSVFDPETPLVRVTSETTPSRPGRKGAPRDVRRTTARGAWQRRIGGRLVALACRPVAASAGYLRPLGAARQEAAPRRVTIPLRRISVGGREAGHTDARLTLRVYSRAMSQDEGEREQLKALVDGRDWRPFATSMRREAEILPAADSVESKSAA